MTDHNDRAQFSAAPKVDDLSLPAIELAVPWSHWLKRLLAANPFYPLSALLLLFGICRVSVDPNFLAREIAQLAFNLCSLQAYALLLVVTAILLARREVWYDSALLVVLDNLLVVVPLILISQAALINARVVGVLCAAAGAIAVLRTANLKRWVTGLNFPPRLAASGFVLLLANVALPIVYVYDFDLRPGLLAPGIWALAWVGCLRFPELCPETPRGIRRALTALPLLAVFLAAGEPGKAVFLTLTGRNLAIYGVIAFRDQGNRMALACLFLTALIFLGGLPETWEPGPALEFSRWKLVGAGAVLTKRHWHAAIPQAQASRLESPSGA